ncbi:hypothetical protein HJC99_04030 [Candidatus Saccharibacteria bacterium]|nr:hypothetical protein [Candidatus Saccharibacteria bacterium]
MLFGIPLLVALIFGLNFWSYRNLKPNRRMSLLLLGGLVLITLCIPLAYLGSNYIDSYQLANVGCPNNYPDTWWIIGVGASGLLCNIMAAVLAFRRRRIKAGFMLAGSSLMAGFIVEVCWFVASFCLTF